ncbi:MAG TPA: hypothetical protein VGG48_01975 [Rhizomicrobium sp.]|jgi:hypothetical protein
MQWGKFIRGIGVGGAIYVVALVVFAFLNKSGQPLISYFRTVELVSLGSLIVLGFDSVKEAQAVGITIPRSLRIASRAISIAALLPFAICFTILLGYHPDGLSHGGRILVWLMTYSELLAIAPLFAFTLANLIFLNGNRLSGALREKVRSYFIFTDLPCAFPAIAVIAIAWSTYGLSTTDSELVLAAGAGTLIFVSNVAALAVNFLMPASSAAGA